MAITDSTPIENSVVLMARVDLLLGSGMLDDLLRLVPADALDPEVRSRMEETVTSMRDTRKKIIACQEGRNPWSVPTTEEAA